jgi:hypothetical protein
MVSAQEISLCNKKEQAKMAAHAGRNVSGKLNLGRSWGPGIYRSKALDATKSIE